MTALGIFAIVIASLIVVTILMVLAIAGVLAYELVRSEMYK
jgi:hypothetical protein